MKNKNILIAEDSYDNYILLKVILEKELYNITHVINGEYALEELKHHKFDLLLIDIQMPVMDGYEFMTVIRKQGVKIPAIAQTAFAFDADRKKSFEVGFDDYITKPIDRELLLSKIKKYI